MTDPERLSQRSSGLAAELLRAAGAEQPNDRGMQQTLLALGLSGAVLSTTSVVGATAVASAPLASVAAAGAANGSAGLTAAGAIKSVSAMLIVKWIGIGVIGGAGLMGVAAVASEAPSPVVHTAPKRTPEVSLAAAKPSRVEPRVSVVASAAPEPVVTAAPSAHSAPVAEARASNPELDPSESLGLEVVYIDRARALLGSGQSSEGLQLLEGYEQKFHSARLLPEVLFLQLEAYERSGRYSDARRTAQRLVDDFPKSPHAGRARKFLGQ